METKNCCIRKLNCYCSKSLLLILITFAFFLKVECQESDSSRTVIKGGSYENTFSTSRIGLAQSVMTTPEGEFHLVIQHRFTDIKGGADMMFGLDGALPRFGFEYGISNWLSAAIGRSLLEKTYDLAFKAAILKQNGHGVPVSLSYYISVLDNTLKNYFPAGHNSFGSRLSYVNQIFIATNQGAFSFQVAPLWVHSNFDVRSAKTLNIFAIDLDARVRLSEKLGLIAEYIPILTKEDFIKTNPLTFGLDIMTGGHQFQVFLSNSQASNEKAIMTNTAGSWSKGHLFFGFNLTRVFHPKMD